MTPFFVDAYDKFRFLQTNIFGTPIDVPLPMVIGRAVAFWFYGIAAVPLVILFIYGALKWISGSDNQEEIQKARKIITTALVGFGIVAFAYIITAVVLRYLGQILQE